MLALKWRVPDTKMGEKPLGAKNGTLLTASKKSGTSGTIKFVIIFKARVRNEYILSPIFSSCYGINLRYHVLVRTSTKMIRKIILTVHMRLETTVLSVFILVLQVKKFQIV